MPGPIPPELVAEGIFVFMGNRQPMDAIDYEAVLSDFDRLLPLYKYVVSHGKVPAEQLPTEKRLSSLPGFSVIRLLRILENKPQQSHAILVVQDWEVVTMADLDRGPEDDPTGRTPPFLADRTSKCFCSMLLVMVRPLKLEQDRIVPAAPAAGTVLLFRPVFAAWIPAVRASFCLRQFGQYQGAGVFTGLGLRLRHLARESVCLSRRFSGEPSFQSWESSSTSEPRSVTPCTQSSSTDPSAT